MTGTIHRQRDQANALGAGATERPRTWGPWPVISGLLLLFGGLSILMGIITAEALYPAVYTTHDNEISDLGATRPPDSIILQPSATIFDTVMLVTGLMVIGAAAALHRAYGKKRASIPLALMGFGILGVGVFPGNYEVQHPFFALLAFVSGGIAALLSAAVQGAPFRYVSRLLGSITLVSLAIGMFGESTPVYEELGDGGIERWIAYPVVLWMTAFGGYLLSASEGSSPATN
jgi:hypothetical membrane protein